MAGGQPAVAQHLASMPGAGLESSSKIGALDGRTSDGPTTPNIGTGIRFIIDRLASAYRASYERGHLERAPRRPVDATQRT